MSLSRRQVLVGGALTGVVAVAGGFALVEEDVVPGRSRLRRLFGACGSPAAIPDVAAGPLVSGSFTSDARRGAEVGWSVAYPAGSSEDAALPVCVALHGRGGDHTWIEALALPVLLADAVGRQRVAPFAIASIDGGNTSWHRRADGDDPLTMVLDELLPRLAQRGLRTERFALWGWSIGATGALLLGARLGAAPVAAIAAASPALWTSYGATQPDAYDDEADFDANDPLARTESFRGIPLRVDCGVDDPLAGAIRRFRAAVDPTPEGGVTSGCHDEAYWSRVAPAQLEFIGTHLDRP